MWNVMEENICPLFMVVATSIPTEISMKMVQTATDRTTIMSIYPKDFTHYDRGTAHQCSLMF